MTIPGVSSVTPTGAFTYTIPIQVPPGTAGIVPKLALQYSSQNGDGYEGLGWTLTGLPAITRCPATKASDGTHGSVNYDANDRLCFMGQELMLAPDNTSGYGKDGAKYRTRIDTFYRVVEHNDITDANAWFEVDEASGRYMRLGYSTASRPLTVGLSSNVVRTWLLYSMLDRKGNYLKVIYNDDTTSGEAYPTEIDYTGNTNVPTDPYNSVLFSYETRPDSTPTYQAGASFQFTKRLNEIKTCTSTSSCTGSKLVFDYKLAYDPLAPHSRLSSVTLCDTTTSNCLPQMTFGWQGGTTPLIASATNNLYQGFGLAAADIDGDGWMDAIALPSDVQADCPAVNAISLGSASGFTPSSINTTYQYALMANQGDNENYSNAACFKVTPHFGDFTGDGLPDAFLSDLSWYYDYGDNNWEMHNFADALLNNGGTSISETGYDINHVQFSAFGDFDGDGRVDGLYEDASNGTPYFSSGTGAWPFQAGTAVSGLGGNYKPYPGDYDGDGCTDLLAQYIGQGGTNQIYSFCNPAARVSVSNYTNSGVVVPGDFNGDGKTDILVVGSNSAKIYLSTGKGFDSGHSVTGGSTWNSYNVIVGDWDGDGKQDVALISKATGNNLQNYFYLSTGTDFTQIGSVKTNASRPMAGTVADWNGDGADDVWLTSTASGDDSILVTFNTQNATTVQPELMTSVNNGLAAAVTAYYYPLNSNGGFYIKGTGAAYPTADADGAYYVIGDTYSDDGRGHTHHLRYHYDGAKIDLTAPPANLPKTNLIGNGFLAFSWIKTFDYGASIITKTTHFRTDIPYVGLISSEATVDGSVTLSSVTNSYSTSDRQGGSTFPHLTTSVIDRSDLHGPPLPEVTNSYGWDDDGNLQTLITSIPGLDPNGRPDVFTTTNTLTNDETNWILGQLTERDVRHIVYYSGGTYSDITRHFSFTPDPATGLTTDAYVEQGVNTCNAGTSSCQLHAAYTLDSYGNRTQTSLSGSGIAARTSTMTPDGNGEFPTAMTDFATHGYSVTYDPRFGVQNISVDPNNVERETDYDTFGRVQTVVAGRANGTAAANRTAVAYTYCSAPNLPTGESCPQYAAYAAISTPQHVSGATQNGAISIVFYDSLGRVVGNDVQGFGGIWSRTTTSYDGNGNISQTSRPYALGAAVSWTQFARDDLGRVLTETFPDQTTTTFCYSGLTSSVTDANGNITTTVRNAEGLIAGVSETPTTACAGLQGTYTTSYVYDAFGDPLSITSVGRTLANTFDQRGRKVTMSDPDMGSWSYSYDVLDELTGQTDGNGNSTTPIDYDKLMRPLDRTEADMGSKWTYDPANGIGLPGTSCNTSSCSTGTGSYKRTPAYDTLERVSQSTLTLDGQAYNYIPAYDANGRLSTLTYPSGFVAEYDYDPTYGYLTQIKDHTSGAVIWTIQSRDAELRLTKASAGNNVTTQWSYDNTGQGTNNDRLLNICASTSDPCLGEVQNLSYGWDPVGNLRARSDTYQNLSENFCYGSVNNLWKYSENGGTCTDGSDKKVLAYDSGNIVRKSDICNTTGCMHFGENGAGPEQLTSIAGTYNGVTNPTFHYDGNGNMLDGAGRSFTWMSFNRIKKITQGTTVLNWSYGPEHQRYKMCASGCGGLDASTLYLYDPFTGGMSEKNTPATRPTTWRDYIVADGQIVAVRILTGSTVAWRYVAGDHLGSVTSIADTVTPQPNVEHDSYDAFGKRRNADGTDDPGCTLGSQLPRGYTGHEMLDQLCLINMNARLYDPGLGIFLQADTEVPNPYSFFGYQRYTYVNDNPLGFVDPTGHVETVVVHGHRYREDWTWNGGDWSVFADDWGYDGGSYLGAITTARSEMGPGDGRGRNEDCHSNGQGGTVDGQGNECVVVTAPRLPLTPLLPGYFQFGPGLTNRSQCSRGLATQIGGNIFNFGRSFVRSGDEVALVGFGSLTIGAITQNPALDTLGGLGIVVGGTGSLFGITLEALGAEMEYWDSGDVNDLRSTVGDVLSGYAEAPPNMPSDRAAQQIAQTDRLFGPGCAG